MRNRPLILGGLVAGLMLLAACTAAPNRLSPRDQLLITCDGLATTMGIVKNFILEGTIREPKTLRDIRSASLLVEETCAENIDYVAALSRLTRQSVILLEARLAAETTVREGS